MEKIYKYKGPFRKIKPFAIIQTNLVKVAFLPKQWSVGKMLA